MLLWSNKLQWSVEGAQWIKGGTAILQGEVGQRHSIRIVFEDEVLGFSISTCQTQLFIFCYRD